MSDVIPVVVAVIITLMAVSILYGFASEGINAVENSILGSEDEEGLSDTDPEDLTTNETLKREKTYIKNEVTIGDWTPAL